MALGGASIAIIAGSVAAAGSAAYAGVSQSQAADAAATNAKRQARWTELQAKANADRLETQNQQALSAQRARLSASGRDPGEGTPLQILADSAATANVDYRNILAGGDMQAAQQRAQASAYKIQGQTALIGGALGATAGVAKGAGSYLGYQDQQAYQQAQMNSYTAGSGRAPPSRSDGSWDWGW